MSVFACILCTGKDLTTQEVMLFGPFDLLLPSQRDGEIEHAQCDCSHVGIAHGPLLTEDLLRYQLLCGSSVSVLTSVFASPQVLPVLGLVSKMSPRQATVFWQGPL